MKTVLFSEDLRECLNAAGFSDCGENDAWNYWYQRLMKSHNECADRRVLTEQAENAELRELVRILYYCKQDGSDCDKCAMNGADMRVALDELAACDGMNERMRELGVEVTNG